MNMRGAALAAGLAALTGGCALGLIPGLAAPASAGTEHITSYVIGAVIEPGGSVRITETISYDFGADRRHGIYRDLPYLQPVNAGQNREYPISGIRASTPDGSPDQTAVSRNGGVVMPPPPMPAMTADTAEWAAEWAEAEEAGVEAEAGDQVTPSPGRPA
jgi:Predicted membrane protein (DUF2207)